jgi:hypothetical protein
VFRRAVQPERPIARGPLPKKERPLSKGNRETRKPKTAKPKVIAAAAPTLLSPLGGKKK